MSLSLAQNQEVAKSLGLGSGSASYTAGNGIEFLAFPNQPTSINTNLNQGSGIALSREDDGSITITNTGGSGVAGVSSISDGTNALAGDIVFIGQGIDIVSTQDPSPAITFSVPEQVAVTSLQGLVGALTFSSSDDSINFNTDGTVIDLTSNGGGAGVSGITVGADATVTGAVTLVAGSNINLDINVDTETITINASVPVPTEGVTTIQADSEPALFNAVQLVSGAGIEMVTNTSANSITLTSNPFVGEYWLTAPQTVSTTSLSTITDVVNMFGDPANDDTCISYSPDTGVWTVLKAGVYFLNFSAGINAGTTVWNLGAFQQAFIVALVDGSTRYNICNSLALSPPASSGNSVSNGQVFGYLTLKVGSTLTCGLQWTVTDFGATPATLQARIVNVSYGTSFAWQFVKAT